MKSTPHAISDVYRCMENTVKHLYKMELFENIVNGVKPYTSFAKSFTIFPKKLRSFTGT